MENKLLFLRWLSFFPFFSFALSFGDPITFFHILIETFVLSGIGQCFLFSFSKVSIDCQPSSIQVLLENLLEKSNETTFQLIDSRCSKTSDDSKVKFDFKFNSCGTILAKSRSWKKYTNIIRPVTKDEKCPFQKIKFSCVYQLQDFSKHRNSRSLPFQSSFEITKCDGLTKVGPTKIDGVFTDTKVLSKCVFSFSYLFIWYLLLSNKKNLINLDS